MLQLNFKCVKYAQFIATQFHEAQLVIYWIVIESKE